MVAGKLLEQTACGRLSATVGFGLIVNTPDAGADGQRGCGPEVGVIITVYVPATVGVKLCALLPGLVAPTGTVHA